MSALIINTEQTDSSALILPKGYKQTELGVIPEDWNAVNFGELYESSISRQQLKPSDYVTFIGMQDVSESAQLVNPSQILYKKVKSGFTYFEKGDVLVAKITPCFENGKGCHTNELATKVGFGSTEFHVLRAKSSADAKFIYFWTIDKGFRNTLETEMVGSAGHRRVPFTAMSNYLIPCPSSKQEQTAIANALSDVDILLSEIEKLISKKQVIKAATMQQLLTGQTRLPEFATNTNGSKKGHQVSELGNIPEDWEVVELGECTSFIGSGKTNTKAFGNYPLYGSTGVIGSCINPEYRGRAILVARVGANAGKLSFVDGEYGVSDNTIIVKLENEVDIQFIKFLLIRQNLNKLVFGSGQPLITGTQLKNLQILLPLKQEQTAIATILSDMDAEIQALEEQLEKTQQIKQGMMQQLLTGKIRLLPVETHA